TFNIVGRRGFEQALEVRDGLGQDAEVERGQDEGNVWTSLVGREVDRFSETPVGGLGVTESVVSVPKIPMAKGFVRFEFDGTAVFLQGLFVSLLTEKGSAQVIVEFGAVGVLCDRLAELRLSPGGVALLQVV